MKILIGQELCGQDDLPGVLRDGKRTYNRFPFACLRNRPENSWPLRGYYY